MVQTQKCRKCSNKFIWTIWFFFTWLFFAHVTYTLGNEFKTLWIQKINQMAKKIVIIFATPKTKLCCFQNFHVGYCVIKWIPWTWPNIDVNNIYPLKGMCFSTFSWLSIFGTTWNGALSWLFNKQWIETIVIVWAISKGQNQEVLKVHCI